MKKECNICRKKITNFINLEKHPCADSFLSKKKIAEKINKYSLIAGYCQCHHLSLVNKISGHERYKKFNYSYTSGNSPISIEHFQNIAKKIAKNFLNKTNNKVLEMASNDGTFLAKLKKYRKIDELGIDPSLYISKVASNRGIKTETLFFNSITANKIQKKYGLYDVIYGANVFNHIEDQYDVINGCTKVLKKNGILILEFPDLDQLFKKISFDTIYHEHRNYYSKQSLINLFSKVNLRIVKFENLEYMSGSLRIYVKNNKFLKINHAPNKSSKNLYKFKKFKRDSKIIRSKLLNFINKKKKQGKIIAGFGAATKGNTLLNYCKVNSNDIKFILETSVHKIGKFTPGSAIPIVDENKNLKFDILIILPWNISTFLKNKIKKRWNVETISLIDIVKKI